MVIINEEDHRRVYGVSRSTKRRLLEKCQKLKPTITLVHFQEFLKFIVSNQSMVTLSETTNYSRKTVGNHIWSVASALYLISVKSLGKDNQNRYQLNKIDTPLGGFAAVAIDGTACPIKNPLNKHDKKEYYSYKHKNHCYKYIVGVGLRTGLAVFLYGPKAGRYHDITLFRESNLVNRLDAEERFIGDKGFQSNELESKILTPIKGDLLSSEDRMYNYVINSNRVIVENYFGRLKRFKILSTPFRAPRLKHKTVFTICVYLTNLDIKEKPLHVDLLKSTNEYSGHNEDLESDSEISDMDISDDESVTSGESLSSEEDEEDDEDDEDDEDEDVEDDEDDDEDDSYASDETLYSTDDE
ncbi:hypothetical protein DLAC_04396 [Tieghemostelium lacteum]|uniref:DDE Tnp4 domain-containing protein n=1 Tax=Tieghemostelium lacteum TaxID=361077 RepID=A0A151ZJI4_TIELA|nr:hypothetical protein DLAC_04396 [Tieghemostelium lacteum]|eukprot:KYQ94116.1 hypothetical protein DLAC_04396 [Tieghemostelium lacteum]